MQRPHYRFGFRLLTASVALILEAIPVATQPPHDWAWPIARSSNNRYLVDQKNGLDTLPSEIEPESRTHSRDVTPAAWLSSQPIPRFRTGHTLPPLTRFGWTLPFEARVELAEHWGYALEFGGYATENQVQRDLANPDSVASRLCALTAANPQRYPLAVIVSRDLPKNVPLESWARDAEGRVLDAKAQSMDGNVWDDHQAVWSPEAPDSVWEEAGRLRAEPLRWIRHQCPIAVVLNGGEYGLGVLGFAQPVWEKDPRIVKAKGERSWFDYVSERKAHQERIISEAIRGAVPDRVLYNYYTAGGGTHRHRIPDWGDWCWGYPWMKGVSDLPSNEAYYRHFNDGWTGRNDMLTLALNAAALEIAHGEPLSYNWLCAGWTRANLEEDHGLGDLARYVGFLKCYYTAGMIGANAGYYEYPKGGFNAEFPADQPPHWLQQMTALAQVHALFSHLERFLREGDLLPGPNRHRFSNDLPAYEFPTGDPEVRVLARRLKEASQWLVTAWAAAGPDREVTLTIPALGELTLHARDCGSVYRVEIADGRPVMSWTDQDGLRPSQTMQTSD